MPGNSGALAVRPALPPPPSSHRYSFVPVFLLEQFARFANFYFLVVAIMQTIPAITITNGYVPWGGWGGAYTVNVAPGTTRALPPPVRSLPTNFLPLGVVLLFDGVVTAREDYTRHVDDRKANTSKGAVLALVCAFLGLSDSSNPYRLERSACDVSKRSVY